MKATQLIILLLLGPLIQHSLLGQSKVDSIYWENGNVSVLSDLGPIWIVQKKGGTLKDVKITEINRVRGTLVYEKQKCLHDISISNISKIEAGKHSLSMMYFQNDNTPTIKVVFEHPDPFIEVTNFKIAASRPQTNTPTNTETELKNPSAEIKKQVTNVPEINAKLLVVTKTNDAPPMCDTLIDSDGEIIMIKVLKMEDKMLNYKKANNMDGPIYVKPFQNAIITRNENSITIKINK